MNRIPAAFLFVCLTAILVVSVACGRTTPEPTAPAPSAKAADDPIVTTSEPTPTAPTKWEYQLDTVEFDVDCASQALSTYQNLEEVGKAIDLGGYSRYTMGLIRQTKICFGQILPSGVYEVIMSDYIACGQQAFDSYAASMGDASWEIVSYSRLQYTLSDEYCSAIVTDYGYEVMWKRPKAAN